jgi:UPF0755 protein
VAHGEREAMIDDDPHALLFGPDDDLSEATPQAPPLSRSEARRASREHERQVRTRRTRRGLFAVALVLILAVAAAVWFVARPIYNDRYHPKDYAGAGTGSVVIKVNPGDDAGNIASTLLHDGVVASTRAFTNAASANSASQGIQPGTYQLRSRMKASAALDLLLTPAARVSARVVVPEGATSVTIAATLAAALHVSLASVRAAMAKPASLGLPNTYTVGTAAPASVEGFLYPATYSFDPGTTPTDALSQMINAYIEQDRSSGFAAAAAALRITPYQALIICSIAQSEARYPDDMAKVARVILNRIAAKMPLQIDATSAYGAKLKGVDPTKIIFATFDSPYNSYLHDGLPPTPISNPGAQALAATAAPPAGNWLYYVNSDAAGHLFFTNSMTAFTAAQLKCAQNNWGCAAP